MGSVTVSKGCTLLTAEPLVTPGGSEIVSLVDRAVKEMADLGAHVEEIDPDLDDPIEIMKPLWSVGLALGRGAIEK